MEHLPQVLSVFLALVAPPAAVFGGLVPRLGPGRAVALALSSLSLRPRFPFSKDVSQRVDDVRTLRCMLSSAHRDQYLVVSGPKGIGKTCLVKSALQYELGIVYVYVAPGTSHDKIKSDALTAITRYYLRMMDQTGSARRVLWWHQFIFRAPVTVVLQAAERKPTQQFADLESAARALTQDFGARVLIDASNNSLPDAATATKREKLLEVEPMQRSLLEELPELEPLHNALKGADMADVVWACVGGNPADYKGLWGEWKDAQCKDIELVVAAFVQDLLGKAMRNKNESVIASKGMKKLFALFRNLRCSEVDFSVLEDMELVRPSPDKVLRAVRRITTAGSRGSGQRILIPADAATALVLRYDLTVTPSMEELKAMLRK
jgi:hypothetical protein